MTANEIVKRLDDMITNKVTVLNLLLDREKSFDEQEESWRRRFDELRGMLIVAQNIGKNWDITCDTDYSQCDKLLTVRIENWK